ncbi:MAG: hypothetical protein D6795_00585 [Deltaproteobacteria bacterium]|nr:MAG: hypothetical protein D6795_00585 [Deltaproteobacteria bacterium]
MPGSTRIVVEDPDAGQTHTYEVTTQPLGGNAAVDPSGNVTYTPNSGFTGSDLFEVTVTDDGAPPLSVTVAIEATVLLNVVITDPADATVTQAATVTVAGTVSTSADLVEVNGIAATLGGGTFQATVPLEEGTNLLVAVARAPSGATGNAVVRLMRDSVLGRSATACELISLRPDGERKEARS